MAHHFQQQMLKLKAFSSRQLVASWLACSHRRADWTLSSTLGLLFFFACFFAAGFLLTTLALDFPDACGFVVLVFLGGGRIFLGFTMGSSSESGSGVTSAWRSPWLGAGLGLAVGLALALDLAAFGFTAGACTGEEGGEGGWFCERQQPRPSLLRLKEHWSLLRLAWIGRRHEIFQDLSWANYLEPKHHFKSNPISTSVAHPHHYKNQFIAIMTWAENS